MNAFFSHVQTKIKKLSYVFLNEIYGLTLFTDVYRIIDRPGSINTYIVKLFSVRVLEHEK